MACWYPSNTAEAWFPQLRINRLAKEAAEKKAAIAKAKIDSEESVTQPKRRRSTKAVTE